MTGLNIAPVVTAVLVRRVASSDCCGARLDLGGTLVKSWRCQGCGQPCGRVLSDPETIEVTNA